ncbi:hypothetical protein AGMMS50256_12920 [Betaproteobacteria bacterium]|nr:hypothetical protein AGMMS50256_12920 [Betaproteobacteria bacterium]
MRLRERPRLTPKLPTGIALSDNRPLHCADETRHQNAQDRPVGQMPRKERHRKPSNNKQEMGRDAIFTVASE